MAAVLVELKIDQSKIIDLIDLMQSRFNNEARRYLEDYQEAEAAVNFAFSKLWEKAKQYNESKPALPYTLSVLRNHCRDILRKRNKTIHTVSLDSYLNKGNTL